ncbi:MAG: class I SAM-dependent methyltransferase [Lachnospiraceae bacterium]|nr:class I SAM-dependent methyltransferase [Lachnospiraceae bacterium]
MEIYGGFADTYDIFMDNIPYGDWHTYLRKLLLKQGVSDGIVVDLGCGTGNMTRLLAEDGYDMIGVDMSAEMLEYARQKCQESVLLLQQDMRKLELYGTAAAMICVCDGMNYLLETEDLRQVFRRVQQFLDVGGVFVFDMKTAHFYETQLGDRTITDNREDVTLIWDNVYHTDTGINEYVLTIYQLSDDGNDLFERVDEHHVQRAYPCETVQRLLDETGFSVESVYEAFTENMPGKDSERIYFVAKKLCEI